MPNKNNTKTPLTTEQQIHANELSRSTVTGFKDGQFIREDVATRFERQRNEAKAMTNKKHSWKQVKTQRQLNMEERAKESQSFYDLRQARQEQAQSALDRLAKQVKSEIPTPKASVMNAKERPANYEYLSDTEKRLIDSALKQ